jgi:hypothetical protein
MSFLALESNKLYTIPAKKTSTASKTKEKDIRDSE